MTAPMTRPASDEYAAFYARYVDAIDPQGDVQATLVRQQAQIAALSTLSEDRAALRYAEGKWSVREVIGHLGDTERVMSYRLLRIARGDETPLPGFDEGHFAAHSNADQRPLRELVDELSAIRASTLALVRSLPASALSRRAVVNNASVTARALVFIIAGHLQHHFTILRERYQVQV